MCYLIYYILSLVFSDKLELSKEWQQILKYFFSKIFVLFDTNIVLVNMFIFRFFF